ncbi:MAG: bifunctional 5,10-methylenetetrahydrofolate dehydrogenase/5,10-methenyltetrahydrofolate cyclohydrolase [Candidatus Colwellbacteria bacterium]|nr:bifunctional 5,10-methylenetetrahydrofolate dehydrogenase/5,10-methenyltetrahydrofolate cyclohydrolase [Candidatus Colwellbacteria bacterium]
MPAIPGEKLAEDLIKKLKSEPIPSKILAAILVGNDPRSLSFLKIKERVAKELGVDFRIYKIEGANNDIVRAEIGRIALGKNIGGVVVELPLPEGVNPHYVLNVIPREKDVDVLGERASGSFYNWRNPVLPPAVGVVEELLITYKLEVPTLKAAIIGFGALVGKPITTWLMGRAAEVYLLGKASDFGILEQANLVVLGVGEPGLVKPEMLKKGAYVIDFGYEYSEGKPQGDFDSSNESLVLSNKLMYTPTPRGTGPILVAKLFENFYKLASQQKIA